MKIFTNFVLMLLLFVAAVPYASAEVEIIETEANYVMDNSFKETMEYATEQARNKAKRKAAEEAGFYIESHSEVVDYKLTKDEITIIAASIMKTISDDIFYNTINDNKNVEVICKLKVKVDTSKINLNNLQEKEKLLKNIKDKDKRIEELEEENKRLKSQSGSATSEGQKQQIQEAFDENQRKFLIAKYERDIDIYDFSSEIDLKSMLETANKLTDIDPLNTSAFLATVYCYRVQDQMQKTIDYCKDIIKMNPSPNLVIEAYTQLGDIYYNELENETEAKKYIDQGIALVKKKYTKAQIEELVNGTRIDVLNGGESMIGKSNSIRELYMLKSFIEDANPIFGIETKIDNMVIVYDKMYSIKYRTDW